MVFVHENGVFPSQTPVLFILMQFQNKKKYVHLLRWNANLILVNIQREFIDQLQETYEIGIDSQLMSQVNWRKKLIQKFGMDKKFKNLQHTLEDILIRNLQILLEQRNQKRGIKKVTFMQNKNVETEHQISNRQLGKQSNIINSPLFKQNLLKTVQITGNMREANRKLNFQQIQSSSNEIEVLKQNIQDIQKNSQLQNVVYDIAIEQNQEQIQNLRNQLKEKQQQISQLEEEKKSLGDLVHTKLSKEDRLIIEERKYSYLKEYLRNKKVNVRPCDVQFWRIKISNSPSGVFPQEIRQFQVIQVERYKSFIEGSQRQLKDLELPKDDIFRMAQEFHQINEKAIELNDQIIQGIVIKKVAYLGVPPLWASMVDQQIKYPNYLGLWDIAFFNTFPLWRKGDQSFQSFFSVKLNYCLYQRIKFDLDSLPFVEFTYSRGMNIIAIINNSPRFEYARYAEGGLESYQILNRDYRNEAPQFVDYIYDGFSLCKYCKTCGFFSSEPSVDLTDDINHYLFNSSCVIFSGMREDIPLEL